MGIGSSISHGGPRQIALILFYGFKPDSSKVLKVLPLEEWPEQFTNPFD